MSDEIKIHVSRKGSHEINGSIKKITRRVEMENQDLIEEALESNFVQESSMDEIPEFDDMPDMAEAAAEAEKYGVIEDEKNGKYSVKMAFIGSGQAGCNIVNIFWELGYRRVMCLNTAAQDMKSLKVDKNNQYVLDGYNGAGKNPKVGREAAEKNYENILRKLHKCFGKNVEHIIVCASAAGGTGSGSAEILVKIAHDYLKEIGVDGKVGVIIASPDKTEKGAMQHNASVIIGDLIKLVDQKMITPMVIVDNGQISKFFPNESITNFYPKSNKIVCGIFDRFNVITAYGSPIGYNVDGADYKELLSGGIMTYGQCKVKEIVDDSTLSEAVSKNVQNTLLCPGFDLSTATNATCLIMAEESELNKITKDSVNKAVESLSRIFSKVDVKVHLGIYKAPVKGVSIYTAVSGLSEPKEKLQSMRIK